MFSLGVMHGTAVIRKLQPLGSNKFEYSCYLAKDIANRAIFFASYEPLDIIANRLQRLNRHISSPSKRTLPNESTPLSFTFRKARI